MSAKRENELVAASERLRACGAFAGGGARGPSEELEWRLLSRLLLSAFRRARDNRGIEDKLACAVPALVIAGKFLGFVQRDLEARLFRTVGDGAAPGVNAGIASWSLNGRTRFRITRPDRFGLDVQFYSKGGAVWSISGVVVVVNLHR